MRSLVAFSYPRRMLCNESRASGQDRSARRLRLRSTKGRGALTSAGREASACGVSEATALFSEPLAWTDKADWRKCMHPHRPIQEQILFFPMVLVTTPCLHLIDLISYR